MAELQSLLNTVAHLDTLQDFDGLRAAREQIVVEHPGSDAAVEAAYKIGLDLLFRARNFDGAVVQFELAAKAKQPFWSAAARTSLGICYYHQRRSQKALFELRKVAYAKEVSTHSVTALAFIENIFETEGKADDASRVRLDRIKQLEQLAEACRGKPAQTAERGYHLYQLGLALKDNHEDQRAHEIWQNASELGVKALGEDLYKSVVEGLRAA